MPFRRKKIQKIQVWKKKQQLGKKSPTCFLCRKLGHYAKQCPKSNKKFVKMMQQIACALRFNDNDDLELVFS